MTEHTNQYCNCHDCTQVRYKSSLAGQVDAAMNNAQPAAPPAPTAIQQSYCMICGQGVVDGTLACGHVYTGWLDKTPAPQGGKCFGKHGPAPATRPAAPPTPQGLETGNVDSWISRYARENAPSDAVGVDIYSAQGTLIGSLGMKEKVEIPAPATRPTEAQEPNRFIPDRAHCARCKKADNLHSPDGICPPQEPKAQEAWMTVTNIHIRKSEDGTWICFKSKDGQAAFSIGNMFPDGAVRRHVIAQWAEEQMERTAIAAVKKGCK